MGKADKKKTRVPANGSSGKGAGTRYDTNAGQEYRKETPLWSFRSAVLAGSPSWMTPTQREREQIYEALKSYETMRWEEICQKPSCHHQEVAEISKPIRGVIAQQAPKAESAFQLRVGKAGRLWGIRIGNVFSIVLWDPDHDGNPMNLADN